MKRGLLLAASIATLVLDMGGGPVFITYASFNINRLASFPAATWLLVRGILNIVQYITVMILCLMVHKVKRYYSRAEEYLVVANLMATNPVAYTYYLMILGGVAWNSLGSCWVATAFRDYNTSFGTCYLVCIVLSWTSTVISPIFVFCGGLVYNVQRRKDDALNVQGSVMDDLLKDKDASFSLEKIMEKLNKDGTFVFVDDILWREKHKSQTESVHTISTSSSQHHDYTPAVLSNEEKPVVVTNIRLPVTLSDYHSSVSINPLLDDLTRTYQDPSSSTADVIVIQHDVLDEDGYIEEDRENEYLLMKLTSQRAVILNAEDVRLQSDTRSHIETTISHPLDHEISPPPLGIPIRHMSITSSTSQEMPVPVVHNRTIVTTERDRVTRGQRTGVRSAKENVIVKDIVFNEESHGKETDSPFRFPYSVQDSDYVDLSVAMIHQLNNGDFDKDVHDENVSITIFSLDVC